MRAFSWISWMFLLSSIIMINACGETDSRVKIGRRGNTPDSELALKTTNCSAKNDKTTKKVLDLKSALETISKRRQSDNLFAYTRSLRLVNKKSIADFSLSSLESEPAQKLFLLTSSLEEDIDRVQDYIDDSFALKVLKQNDNCESVTLMIAKSTLPASAPQSNTPPISGNNDLNEDNGSSAMTDGTDENGANIAKDLSNDGIKGNGTDGETNSASEDKSKDSSEDSTQSEPINALEGAENESYIAKVFQIQNYTENSVELFNDELDRIYRIQVNKGNTIVVEEINLEVRLSCRPEKSFTTQRITVLSLNPTDIEVSTEMAKTAQSLIGEQRLSQLDQALKGKEVRGDRQYSKLTSYTYHNMRQELIELQSNEDLLNSLCKQL